MDVYGQLKYFLPLQMIISFRKAKLSGGGLVNTDSEKGKGELFIHFKCFMVQAEIINASISTITTTTSLVLTQALNIFDTLTHLLLSTII